MKYTIYCDGLCEPNPGSGAWAFIVFDEHGSETAAKHDYMGKGATNNMAEYRAVIEALAWCREIGDGEFLVLTDSQLVVNQVNGLWQVKSDNIQGLFNEAVAAIGPNVKIAWVKGTENKADELTRVAYEKGTGLYPMPRTSKGQWKAKLISRELPSAVDYDKIFF